MANEFVTLLEDAGTKIKDFFENLLPEAVAVATVAEPIVDIAFPGIAVLFNATVAAVGKAEATGQSAASISGSDQQKLASVLVAEGPLMIAYLQQNGININTAQLTAWINAIVAALNALPAPVPAPSSPAPSSSTPATTTTEAAGASTVTVTESK